MTHKPALSGIAVAEPIEQPTERLRRNTGETRARAIQGIFAPDGRIGKA
ncbi:MAG TPA: hypothetical protein VJ776_11500 [Thermoanaerobaculia bacterium]|nr:hypothetical protein [Thermoanaerobaculia bacterium]